MKAFVIRAAHRAAVEERPTPTPGPGEGLVRVRACGICGSDLHAYEGSQPFFQYPQVPGHEVVGELVELRPRPGGPMQLPNRPIVTDLQVGDRVVLDPAMPCGQCCACLRGRYNCCVNQRVIGVHAPGALAEYYTAPLECLQRVPADMTDELAALVEPLSIGVQANSRGRISAEDSVLVIGGGTIGLCVMMVAQSRGARVAVTDLSPVRRDKALALGADAAFDPRAESFTADLEGFFGPWGPSVVVEAVGTPATVAQALELVCAGGRVVLLGLISREIILPGAVMVRKELDFVGSRLHGGTIPQTVELIAAGKVPVAGLVTHRLDLDHAEEGLKLMASRPDEVLKAIVYVP
jgi:L-gulonate 5-dehydrogenase